MVEPVRELPMRFGMALLQNEQAAAAFQTLPPVQRRQVLQRTHTISSKAEMRALVNKLAEGSLPSRMV